MVVKRNYKDQCIPSKSRTRDAAKNHNRDKNSVEIKEANVRLLYNVRVCLEQIFQEIQGFAKDKSIT